MLQSMDSLTGAILFGCVLLVSGGRPHIIMMLADDWGSYDASYRMKELGRKPDIQTPTIDQLGAEGVRFSNYYVQPICTPTRAGLMTGRYSIHTGSEHILFGGDEPSCMPLDVPMMPEAFQKLGYQTHMIGKWHLGYFNDSCTPWGRGFDTYLGYLNGNANYYCNANSIGLDFHECYNGTEPLPSRPFQHGYANVTGLMSGPDASDVEGGPLQHVTYSEAVQLCDATTACFGFTFESANPQPDTPVLVRFKQSTDYNPANSTWHSYISRNAVPKSCATKLESACTVRYEGKYSTEAYTERAQTIIEKWKADDPPIFMYIAWQAVHEPMDAPDRYLTPYDDIKDPTRRLYAGMLSALDEGIGNITQSLKNSHLYNNTVMVLSNDNGGMSGSYGLGCCKCGTSCGGLNYPYRGWKDSFWEGGFRGIGFVHSPLLQTKGYVYRPLLHVSDWYKTLLGAATKDDREGAEQHLGRQWLHDGPIDSIDHWESLCSGGTGTAPRSEVLLAGIDSDKRGAAIRAGDYKLLVGDWGSDAWCDLNVTGFSPHYPAPVDPNPHAHGPGGEGGLYCSNKLPGVNQVASPRSGNWTDQVKGLYNIVEDPREMNDLQETHPDIVLQLRARLTYWQKTTVPSIHTGRDPKGMQHRSETHCASPWQDWHPTVSTQPSISVV